jgi:hypothetical protein
MADTVPNIPADNTETAPVDTIAPDAGDQPGVQAAPADAEAQAAKGSLATDTQATPTPLQPPKAKTALP